MIESCHDEALHSRLRRKEYYLGVSNLKTKHQIRQLTADKIGKLVRISGQIVRTHPVHPELCLGNFVCEDCGTTVADVPQQFKYTQVKRFFLHSFEIQFSQQNATINNARIVRDFFSTSTIRFLWTFNVFVFRNVRRSCLSVVFLATLKLLFEGNTWKRFSRGIIVILLGR